MSLDAIKARAAEVAGHASPQTIQGEVAVVEDQAPAVPAIDDHAAQDELFAWLKGFSGYWNALLPVSVNPERFELAAFTVLQNSSGLRQVIKNNHLSFVYSLAMCAHFGLMPDGVQAALIPYKG